MLPQDFIVPKRAFPSFSYTNKKMGIYNKDTPGNVWILQLVCFKASLAMSFGASYIIGLVIIFVKYAESFKKERENGIQFWL